MASQVIFTAATGYRADQLRPFADSLRATGCRAPVVALVHDVSPLDLRQFHEWNIHPVNIQERPGLLPRKVALKWLSPRLARMRQWTARQWRYWPALSRLPFGWHRSLAAMLVNIMSARFLYFGLLLREAPAVEQVLITDARDVLFQQNPFDHGLRKWIIAPMEDRRGSIGDVGGDLPPSAGLVTQDGHGKTFQGINAAWVHRVFGETVLQRMAALPILCAGVVMGPRSAMNAYLESMAGHVLASIAIAADQMGVDQAMHNHLVWLQRPGLFQVRDNRSGPVFTAHGVPDAELRFDSTSRLVQSDGHPYSVVHQYDRSARLRDWASKRPWESWSCPRPQVSYTDTVD